MASKRMFSIRLIESARFIRMPISSQALYFHLGMRADDDGIVEAYPVIKMTGCTEDDLRVLVSKGFVQVLNDDLVAYIVDWNENNLIRPDRKIDSMYKNLLLQINPDVDLIEKRERADAKKKDIGQAMDRHWTDNGRAMDGIGKDSIGKDSIDKSISTKPPKRFTPPKREEVADYCRERGNKVDPDRFVDFYTSKGWMVGKSPMKDWKAAVRGWEREAKQKAEKPQNRFAVKDQANNYDFEALERRKREAQRS